MREKNVSKPYYGVWIVVGIWLVYFLAAPPGSYASSIISTRMVTEYGWGEGVIGAATSVFYLMMALASIPTSLLIKKYGIRRTIITGAGVGILSYALLAYVVKIPLLYIAVFGGIGISSTMCAIVSGSTTIAMWYDRNKAMPMSILITAGSIGGFIMPLLVNKMLTVGTRLCWEVFILMDIAVIVIAVLILKNRPEEIGEIKDGRAWTAAHPVSEVKEEKKETDILPLKSCYHSKQFYILCFQTFCARASNAGITSYVIVYAMQNKISAEHAALLITVYNLTSLFGRFSIGLLDKKMKQGHMNTIALGLVAAECLSLYFASDYHMFALSVALGGMGFGALVTLLPLLEASFFGNENFVLINGTFNTIGTLGSFLSPMMIFAVAQMVGGYRYSYALLGGALAVAAISAWLTPVIKISKKSVE